MNFVWVTIGLIAVSIWGYIQYLRSIVDSHQTTIDILNNKSKATQWIDEINKLTDKIKETEIDYNKQAEDFRKRYPSTSDGSSPPTGTGKL